MIGNGGIVPFNNVSTGDSFDTDGVFNTTTYKFTAPATGVYTFWFSIYTSQNDSSNSFSFLKNSSIIDLQNSVNNLATYAASTDDNTLSFTCVLPLASGDTIAVCGAVRKFRLLYRTLSMGRLPFGIGDYYELFRIKNMG